MQIHSGGLLRATPHHVRSPAVPGAGVSRNTFAVFMQPRCAPPWPPCLFASGWTLLHLSTFGQRRVEGWLENLSQLPRFAHDVMPMSASAGPRWDEPMEPPAGSDPDAVGIGQWRPGMTFGEFSEATMAKYYGAS